jgi:hypothetical protein
LILWCISLDKLLQFSNDGVQELGFGEAVTKSFFCELADAFSKGEFYFLNDIWARSLQTFKFSSTSFSTFFNIAHTLQRSYVFTPVVTTLPSGHWHVAL